MINKEYLKEHINTYFEGILSKAARKMGLDKSTISKMLSGKRDIGKKTLEKLDIYCKNNNFKINQFIFFNSTVDKW